MTSPLDIQGQHRGGRVLPAACQILVQAAQSELPAHLGLDDAGADAPAADEHTLLDQVLHRPAHRRTGQAELLGEQQLVVQPAARGKPAVEDGRFEGLGDLEVQGRGSSGPRRSDAISSWDSTGAGRGIVASAT